MGDHPQSREKVEQRRVVILRFVVVLAILLTAFWSCDRAGVFFGYRSQVLGVLLNQGWYCTAAWILLSSLVAVLRTDRRNFVYLFAVCAANLNTAHCLLLAVS